MKKSILTMAALAVTMLASANPFLHYKEWKSPHGTYPFNDIRPEHYMPLLKRVSSKVLQRLTLLSTTLLRLLSRIPLRLTRNLVNFYLW